MVSKGLLSLSPAALAQMTQSSRLPGCIQAVTSVTSPVSSQCRFDDPTVDRNHLEVELSRQEDRRGSTPASEIQYPVARLDLEVSHEVLQLPQRVRSHVQAEHPVRVIVARERKPVRSTQRLHTFNSANDLILPSPTPRERDPIPSPSAADPARDRRRSCGESRLVEPRLRAFDRGKVARLQPMLEGVILRSRPCGIQEIEIGHRRGFVQLRGATEHFPHHRGLAHPGRPRDDQHWHRIHADLCQRRPCWTGPRFTTGRPGSEHLEGPGRRFTLRAQPPVSGRGTQGSDRAGAWRHDSLEGDNEVRGDGDG